MSIFDSLGRTLGVPNITTGIQETVSSGAAQVQNYVSSNFSLPNLSLKAAELGQKLNFSGLAGNFGTALVKPQNVSTTVSGALTDLQREAITQRNSTIPAGLVSGGGDRTPQRKVRISQSPRIPGMPHELVFTVMPRIDERGSAEYDQVQPVHHPGAMLKYRGSSTRSWNISGKLIARNRKEATENLDIINMIRAWRMPFYGEGTSKGDTYLQQLIGAPPPILTLEGYGPRMIGPVKCVLKDYNWTMDNTLDYIDTMDSNPSAVPVIIEISLSLEESWSPAEYSGFDLKAYRAGNMTESFKSTAGLQVPASGGTPQAQIPGITIRPTEQAQVIAGGFGGGADRVNPPSNPTSQATVIPSVSPNNPIVQQAMSQFRSAQSTASGGLTQTVSTLVNGNGGQRTVTTGTRTIGIRG